MKFGRMTVLRTYRKKQNDVYKYLSDCICDCGTIKTVSHYDLKGGKTLSCGCLKLEKLKERNAERIRKMNCYETMGDGFVIGKILAPPLWMGAMFIIDADDYSTIKEYWWRINSSGYVTTTVKLKEVSLHRLVMGNPEGIVDHIDRDKLNNRKSNLRLISDRFSAINKDPTKANTSGIVGVNYTDGGWVSRISSSLGERMFLGKYKDKRDAIISRLAAEKEFYKEYAPQKHLFKEYGIE